MRILLIHQNFPGQFRHLAAELKRRPDINLYCIGRDTAPGLPGIDLIRYQPNRKPQERQHHYLRHMENAVLHGQAVARVLLKLRHEGFKPDVILAHPGWGETLYAKDVFPETRLIHLCEWYYAATGGDCDFDPEFPISFDDRARIRTRNALHSLNLENCDLAITPTQWQKNCHPPVWHDKIAVIHEGSYGKRPADHPNWREKMLAEVKIDPARTHFLGQLPYESYRRVLQVSAAHVYLTYPFVLSWSCLEAMASGCLVIGSDTPPVKEVIRDGKSGRLVNFFDIEEMGQAVIDVLTRPEDYRAIRNKAAAEARKHIGVVQGIAGYLKLLGTEEVTRERKARRVSSERKERVVS